MPSSYYRHISILATILAAFTFLMAFNPNDRQAWVLENILFLGFIAFLIVTFKPFPLSRTSYTLIFVFLMLHQIGAHYTYALVPYDQWFDNLFGITVSDIFGLERNHFDRLTHFSYGLLLAYPVREIFIRIADAKGFWGYFLPLDVTMSTSMLYELIEWGAAIIFGGALGQAYLGTQGDVWDAHWDMALASLGALITLTIVASIHKANHRDFAREWNESLRVKNPLPLNENFSDSQGQ